MEYYVLTKTGDREINEDCARVVETEQGFCCILADGLGGHDRGEVASALVTDVGQAMFQEFCLRGGGEPERYLGQCFMEAQKQLLSKQQEAKSEMKTTMVVLASIGNRVQWGHIGDSRLYQFQSGRLTTRTLDHSVPQMLVMTGEIKEKDIRGHEDRNRLLRVMGVPWNTPKFELSKAIPASDNQAYLLCSDGFWELVGEQQMVYALNCSDSPGEWVEAMEKEVQKNGRGKNMDNYTAIGVFLGERVKRKKFWRIKRL